MGRVCNTCTCTLESITTLYITRSVHIVQLRDCLTQVVGVVNNKVKVVIS